MENLKLTKIAAISLCIVLIAIIGQSIAATSGKTVGNKTDATNLTVIPTTIHLFNLTFNQTTAKATLNSTFNQTTMKTSSNLTLNQKLTPKLNSNTSRMARFPITRPPTRTPDIEVRETMGPGETVEQEFLKGKLPLTPSPWLAGE